MRRNNIKKAISTFLVSATAIVLTSLMVTVPSKAYGQGDLVRHVATPDIGKNQFTVQNRAPLAPSAFAKLPITSIRPEGWVRKQLELEAEGFTGRLTEISPWLVKKNNAWLNPTGEGVNGWEEVPYWLKGFGDLGYVLKDKRITTEAKRWIDGVISSQRENGYFGPASNLTANNGKPDIWPNMVMLDALQSYYEVSADRRILSLMSRYFKWVLTIPKADFLLSYWEPQRVGDNIASIYWLYNRTGEAWLFEVVEKLHASGANWTAGVANWHGVNMAQGFREPAEYYLLTHDRSLIAATETDYLTMRRKYGQVPGGLYGADENARVGFADPRQAAETCTMVEMMLSDEMLLTITGDSKWADRLEDVTFNSLPASMTSDMKSLHYLTSPNLVQIDKGSKAPELQNSGPMLLFNAYDHRCCQHNTSHGWPYYAEHLWLATGNNGLAVAFFGPSTVTAKAGNGNPVTITESTNYPFRDLVQFKFKTVGPNRFPLTLRWPAWCNHPTLKLNGRLAKFTGTPGGYIVIERTWQDQDKLDLTLPMSIVTKTQFHGSVSVNRGPLTYSVKIGEKIKRVGGTERFPALEIYPTSPWNYGLVDYGQNFRVVEHGISSNSQPFTIENSPIEIIAKVRRIPEWQSDRLGLVGLLQDMPAKSTERIESIHLIPMGAARLRITAFPVVSQSASAHRWVAPRKAGSSIRASASHVFDGDSVDALSLGSNPVNSDDESIPRFTWWDRKGSTEWVQYDFIQSKSVSEVRVYWFDDESTGGGCRVPDSWRLLYDTGNGWMAVTTSGNYNTIKNRFNSVKLDPIQTSHLRIEVNLKKGFSGGILAWEVR